MQVSQPNDVKIYNLSVGKSLPEWLSDKQKRRLGRKDLDIRRRIELIQDFKMPVLSSNICMSPDGQYVLVSGIYKPRIRCYDLSQLALKFERCLESEIVKFLVLSSDYSKLVFLHDDRFVEIHNQHGRYYRFRIPKLARDMVYNPFTCDCMFVGVSSTISRFNLEVGSFMPPFQSSTTDTNISACDVSRHHGLFVAGNEKGVVDAFDSRASSQRAVMSLNCRLGNPSVDEADELLSISKLKFKDGLRLGVGTSTGQVMLYDIRAQQPYIVKDHQYAQPIIDMEFLSSNTTENNSALGYKHLSSYTTDSRDLVISMDQKIIKIWDAGTNNSKDINMVDATNLSAAAAMNGNDHDEIGKTLTAIEPGCGLNDLCLVPNSGMLFVANETQKVLVYFIPAMGPAPVWCQALETITEELEETQPEVYDDYKFVTSEELAQLGLEHLIGTPVLRAYMHGYFMNLRLYNKAKSIAKPVTYEQFRQEKLQQAIERDRKEARVKLLESLPVVNRELARKYAVRAAAVADDAEKTPATDAESTSVFAGKTQKKQKSASTAAATPLTDERFRVMFEDPAFEMDPEDEEYKLHNAAVLFAQQNPGKSKGKQQKIKKSFDIPTDELTSSDEETDTFAHEMYGGDPNNNNDVVEETDEAWIDAITSTTGAGAEEVDPNSAAEKDKARKQRQEAKKRVNEQRRRERKAGQMQNYENLVEKAQRGGDAAATVVQTGSQQQRRHRGENDEDDDDEPVTVAETMNEKTPGRRRVNNNEAVSQNAQGGRSITFTYTEESNKKEAKSRSLQQKVSKHSRQQFARKIGRKK